LLLQTLPNLLYLHHIVSFIFIQWKIYKECVCVTSDVSYGSRDPKYIGQGISVLSCPISKIYQ